MKQLYKISDDFKGLQELVDNGEVTPDMIADTLEGVELMFNEKAAAVVTVANQFKLDAELIDTEIKRLQDMKKSMLGQRDSLIEYLRTNMEKSGIKKIECPLFKITLRDGSKMVSITDESALPDDYVSVKTTIAPDKRKILSDLKAGVEIEGAEIEIGKSSVLIK